MQKISYAIKINSHIVTLLKKFCLEHGIKQGFFVEKALREQLAREELAEDIRDLKALHLQEEQAVNLADYLKKRAG